MSDAYHSCYVLSGLSSAQHQWELDDDKPDATETAAAAAAATPSEAADPVWTVLPYLDGLQVFDTQDRVRPIHPVYAIPQQNVRAMKAYFRDKQGFF
jgi:protein farnesyltransferase subunit beta